MRVKVHGFCLQVALLIVSNTFMKFVSQLTSRPLIGECHSFHSWVRVQRPVLHCALPLATTRDSSAVERRTVDGHRNSYP